MTNGLSRANKGCLHKTMHSIHKVVKGTTCSSPLTCRCILPAAPPGSWQVRQALPRFCPVKNVKGSANQGRGVQNDQDYAAHQTMVVVIPYLHARDQVLGNDELAAHPARSRFTLEGKQGVRGCNTGEAPSPWQAREASSDCRDSLGYCRKPVDRVNISPRLNNTTTV